MLDETKGPKRREKGRDKTYTPCYVTWGLIHRETGWEKAYTH